MSWYHAEAFRRLLRALVTALCACLAVLASSALERSGAATATAAAAGKGPTVSKVAPRTVRPRQRLTISGRRFARGRRANTVIFLGRRGRRDDFKVKATAKSSRRIVLRAPAARLPGRRRGAVSGRIQVVNRLGKSRPSRTRVIFDNDRDGLSNERELELGTDPRRADTDGDGTPDGRDSDPLHAPPDQPSTPPSTTPPSNPPPTRSCASPGPERSGSGVASTFAGLQNVIQEARARISHPAYAGSDFRAFCLRRKVRGGADSTYQVTASSTSSAAGTLQDGQRPAKGVDYVYRIDVVTPSGYLKGTTVGARGAASVANVNGWAQLEQSCTQCGTTSVQAGSLRSTVQGDGQGDADDTVGEVAVYNKQIELKPRPVQGTQVTTRVLAPLTPSTAGTHVAGQLNLSVDHPAAVRDDASGRVADLLDSPRPWITVELRSKADGAITVVAKDSAAPGADKVVGQSGDLLAGGALDNVYLTVQLTGTDQYEVRYKRNGAEDTVLDLDPAGPASTRSIPGLPGQMAKAWLSLDDEMSRREDAARDVRFDEVDAVYQTNYEDVPQENFGGTAVPIQLPQNFEATALARDLLAPTAIDFAPDGDMYIAERDGKVKRRSAAAPNGVSEVLDINDLVNSGPNDQGLLGFVLDPGFAGNRFFYVYYTVQKDDAFGDRTVSRVERFHVGTDGTASRTDPLRKVLVGDAAAAPGTGDSCPPSASSDCLPSDSYTHSAGGLKFGGDGKLWVSTPDGASPEGTGPHGTDPLALRSVNSDSLAGKLLRVEPDSGEGVASNPTYNAAQRKSPRSRTWAMGFRNPFRLAQRPGAPNGSWFLTDVGWGAFEELDRVPGTASGGSVPNYGWPCYEGTPPSPYKDDYPAPLPDGCGGFSNPVAPLHEYDSSGVDHAIIGGGFYSGQAYPAPWKPGPGEASFFYSDYPSGEIKMVKLNASDQKTDVRTFAGGFPGPVMITEGPADPANPGADKALYVVNLGPFDQADGKVWRITYQGP